MTFEPLEKIANAVLYEGFLLYPYRKSSVKNQQRWHFGTVGPVGGQDPTSMQTECLVEGGDRTSVIAKIRFLQNDIEQVVDLDPLPPTYSFAFGPLTGRVDTSTTQIGANSFRITIRIENLTREQGEGTSLLSAHTMLMVRNGAFLSLIDPPDQYREAARACKNVGTWPVLAGKEGDCHLLLSSPIILYDYPQIAPESAGDLFDGTEIDEILTLRVLTLSDDEKQEVRAGSEQGRGILERSETLPPEAFAKMHGAIRGLRNASKLAFREGDRVRLRPRKKADIFDIALEGKIAIIEAVERDFENNVHLAVTVEDDPGREFGVARQIGHRFFFGPEEVELV